MEEFMKGREDIELFQELPPEVLRDRFRIHVTDLGQMDQTVEQVKQVQGVADVRAELAIARGFITVRNIAGAVALILIAILLIISLFIYFQHHPPRDLYPARGDRHHENVRRHKLVHPVPLPV